MSGLDLWGVGGGNAPRLMGQQPRSGGVQDLAQFDGDQGEVAGLKDSAFGQLLTDAVHQVKSSSADVKDKVEALAAGEPVKLHDVLMAMGKSRESFNLMLEIRNKLVDAWQTLERSVV